MRPRSFDRIVLCLAFAAALLAALPAAAAPRQHRKPRHHAAVEGPSFRPSVYLGVGLAGSKLTEDYDFPDVAAKGMGLHLFGGVRFSPRVALELGWLGLQHDARKREQIDAAFQAGMLDFKIFLGRPGPIEAYLMGGLGIYGFSSNETDESLTGGGGQFGGGIDVHLSSEIALSARGAYHIASLDNGTDAFLPTEEAALRFLEGSITLRVDF